MPNLQSGKSAVSQLDAPHSWRPGWPLVLLLGGLVGIPLLSSFQVWPLRGDYLLLAVLIPFLILSLASIGLNILTGYCGQISLGSGAFMAIGAYGAYKFATGISIDIAGVALSLPPLPGLPSILLGGLSAAAVGLLVGLPSLRIKGLYLAVATLATQFFFDWVFLRIKWFTNYAPSGSVTAPDIRILDNSVQLPIEKYLVCLAFTTIFAWLAGNLARGNVGRQWMAVRDMDIAAELIGVRPLYAKLSAFAISSFIIGVAGALWAFVYLGSWEPLAFNIDRSFQLLFMAIIGGLGSIGGSFLGTAFILVMPIALRQVPGALGYPLSTETIAHLEFIIFGSLIIVLLIREPHGFARLLRVGGVRARARFGSRVRQAV